MKTRNKLIQQRQNTSINFLNASQSFKDLKLSFVNQGKLEDQGETWSTDQLTKTWTLVFSNNQNLEEFKNHPLCIEYYENMLDHNSRNQISFSIETDEIE